MEPMRRLLPFLVLVSAVSALFAGVAWSGTIAQPRAERAVDVRAGGAAAPFLLPGDTAPARDAAAGTSIHGYVTAARLGALLDAEERADAPTRGAQAAGTIVVSARVLPTVTIQLDARGDVASLVVNTPQRDARRLMFHVDGGSLDATTWPGVRRALAGARAGTGTVWTR